MSEMDRSTRAGMSSRLEPHEALWVESVTAAVELVEALVTLGLVTANRGEYAFPLPRPMADCYLVSARYKMIFQSGQ